jgi:hypothetical protein
VISEIDISRAANVRIKQHGDDAPIFAAQRIAAMVSAGDRTGRPA